MLDARGRVVTWNQGAQRMKQYAPGEIIGQDFARFFTPEELAEGEPRHALEVAAREGHYSVEGWRVRKDGSRFWAAVTVIAVYDASGKLRSFGKVVQDLTQRRQAEEAVRSAALFPEENPFPVLRAGRDGTFLFANRSAAGLLAEWQCRVGGPTPEAVRGAIQDALEAGTAQMLEIGVGERRLSFVVMPIGERDYVNLYGRDVTEQKRAEEAVREREQRFRSIAENLSEGLMIFGAQGDLIYQNAASLRIHGLSAEEGERIVQQDLPARWQGWDEQGQPLPFDRWPVSRALRGESFENQVLHARRSDTGLEFEASYNGCPIRDEAGKVRLAFITIREITQQRKAEAAVRASEARLREAQRLAHVGSWHWDVKTDATSGSEELLRIYGFDPATQTMPSFKDQCGRCYPVEDWERINAAVQRTLETGLGYELDVRVLRNGTSVWATTRSEVVRDAQGQIVGLRGTVQDITERKQAEQALRESEERFRVAQELSPDGFSILRPVRDERGRVVDFTWVYENAAAARFTGKQPSELLGRRLLELFPAHRGTDFFKAYQEVAETGKRRMFEAHYGAETVAPAWFRAAVVPVGSDIAVLAQDITRQKEFQAELEQLVAERTEELQQYKAHLEELVKQRTGE